MNEKIITLKQVVENPELSIENIYNENFRSIKKLCLEYFDNEIAEEITQETFLKLFSKSKDLYERNPDININTYLITIAKNIITNHLRKKTNKSELKDISYEECPDLSRQYDSTVESSEIIEKAFNELNIEERNILNLIVVTGLSIKKLAATLGITDAAARCRIHHIRKKLRDILEKKGGL